MTKTTFKVNIVSVIYDFPYKHDKGANKLIVRNRQANKVINKQIRQTKCKHSLPSEPF